MGGAHIQGVRDRPRRISGTAIRWGILYVSASLALLQTLDVFSERLGLSDGAFLYVTVAFVLLLPGVLGAAALRALAREERTATGARLPARRERPRPRRDAPGRGASGTGRRAAAAPGPPPAPEAVAPSAAELADLHYRLGRWHEARGKTGRAAYHYARFLEAAGAGEAGGAEGPARAEPSRGPEDDPAPGR